MSERTTKPMRDQYELKGGRPNRHAARLGQKGRAALVRSWSAVADNVRVLPKDLAREFPDTRSTVAALRLVVRLRKADLKGPSHGGQAPRKRPVRRRSG